jgi:hypothetical protein
VRSSSGISKPRPITTTHRPPGDPGRITDVSPTDLREGPLRQPQERFHREHAPGLFRSTGLPWANIVVNLAAASHNMRMLKNWHERSGEGDPRNPLFRQREAASLWSHLESENADRSEDCAETPRDAHRMSPSGADRAYEFADASQPEHATSHAVCGR